MRDYLTEGAEEEFRRRVRGTAMWAAIAGAMMLYFGVGTWISRIDSRLYVFALDTRMWTLRIGGGAMLCVATLCLSGWSAALLLDAIACAAISAALAFVGGVFLLHGDWEGILTLLFAALFGNAAFRSWRDYIAWRQVTAIPRPVAGPEVPSVAITDPDHSAVASLRRKKDVRAAAKRASEAANVATARPVAPVTEVAAPQPMAAPLPAVIPVASEPSKPGRQPRATESRAPESRPTPSAPPVPPATSEPDTEPAEGFLAALAREDKKEPPKE